MALTLSGTNKIVNDNLNTEVKTLFTPKNWIINGGFDVWQRGTSQTSSGYGSDDRWSNQNGGSTKTHSQQMFSAGQTDVPNNPTYFSRTIVSSIAGSSNFVIKEQRIEDVSKLSGKTVSLSFWAKADSSKNLSIQFAQNFGSGGSSSVEPLGVQKFSLTTSWQRFTKTFTLPSISGKTIGSGNYIQFRFFFDAGSVYNTYTDSLGQQSGTFDLANVSLVEGSVPVEWQTEAYADVYRACRRHYRTESLGLLAGRIRYADSNLSAKSSTIFFDTPMMKTPSVTFPSGLTVYGHDGSSQSFNPTIFVNTTRCYFMSYNNVSAGTLGYVLWIEGTAVFEAEL